MAVAAVATGFASGSTISTLTVTLTVSSASNSALVFWVGWGTESGTVSSVVWDAAGANQAFTAIAAQFTTGTLKMHGFQLVNPTSGTNKLVTVTMSATVTNLFLGGGHYSGVDQTTPIRAGSYITDTDLSVTVTSQTDDITTGIAVASNIVGTTNQTLIGKDDGLSAMGCGVDYAVASGNVTHTWTGNGATQGIAGCSIAATAGAAAAVQRRMLLFQGVRPLTAVMSPLWWVIARRRKLMKIMNFFALLFPFLCPSFIHATVLNDTITGMSAGTWATFTPGNTAAINTMEVADFTDSATWDPINKKLLFIGGTHTDYEFPIYDESTNAWIAGPAMTGLPFTTDFVGHGFEHQVIDPATGSYYYHPRDLGAQWRKYNVAANTWSDLADNTLKTTADADVDASTWVPELNSILWFDSNENKVWRYNETTDVWTEFATFSGLSGSWRWAEYNPVHKFVLFGDGSGTLRKITSAGVVSSMTAISCATIYSGTGYAANVTVDPTSGKYLILEADTRSFFIYDPIAQSCSAGTAPPAGLTGGIVAAPVSNYGATLFVRCGTSGCPGVLYVYKHSTDAYTNFRTRCTTTGVILCIDFDTTNDFVQNTFIFPAGDTNFYGTRDIAVAATGDSSLKFRLPAGSSNANISGFYRSANWSQTFSQNSHWYAQYQTRLSPEMLSNMTQWDSEWKNSIFHMSTATCGGVEITNKIRNDSNHFFESYTDCGATPFYLDDGVDIYVEQGANPKPTGAGYWCAYPALPGPPGTGDCFFLQTNKWITYYWDVQIGTWGSANSTVKAYVAIDGGGYQQIVNLVNTILSRNSADTDGYNSVDFLPYMTSLSTSASVDANVWYDELIVSTQPIVAPGAVNVPIQLSLAATVIINGTGVLQLK